MTTPLPKVWPTVIDLLKDAAVNDATTEALVCGDERLDYRAWAACVAGFAQELAAGGLRPGDRAVVLMANSIDLAVALLAVQAAGAQVVPLNPDYPAWEVGPILASAAPHTLLVDEGLLPRLGDVLATAGRVVPLGRSHPRLTRWRDDADLPGRLTEPEPHATSTLQYTGGTTGKAKGVQLTHQAVATNVSQREALVPMRRGLERLLVITPLFHVYAASMGLHMALYSRSTLVILPRYRPDFVLEAIARHRITVMLGSPTIYSGLLGFEGLSAADLSSLEVSVSGSSALPAEVLRQWETLSGSIVIEGYGQTESGPVVAFNPRFGLRKPGSVGIVTPETTLEIVDLDTGLVPVPPGEAGEIRVKGPQLMTGYRDMPEETAAALREGWLYTGDIGAFDEDGYLFIRGRKKEMAIVAGYNVYPREVEEALYTHPAVAEVAVVSVPDSHRGEALIAVVVSSPATPASEADLIAYLSGRLVRYKVPGRIVVAERLPKTTVGKVDKARLRADLLAAPALS